MTESNCPPLYQNRINIHTFKLISPNHTDQTGQNSATSLHSFTFQVDKNVLWDRDNILACLPYLRRGSHLNNLLADNWGMCWTYTIISSFLIFLIYFIIYNNVYNNLSLLSSHSKWDSSIRSWVSWMQIADPNSRSWPIFDCCYKYRNKRKFILYL